jgi:hypothetical protein
MENQPSQTINARMPRSLNECIAPYPTTENLYRWANRLKILGEVLCGIIIILGFFNLASIIDTLSELPKEDAFSIVLVPTIIYVLSGFVALCIFHVLSVLLEALATTVQCRVIATKVALFEANQKIKTSDE